MDFRLYHLVIRKGDLKPPGPRTANDNGTIIEVEPDYNLMMDLIKAVGGDSGWHLRRDYQDPDSIADLKHRIKQKSARLFLFQEAGQTIGFCQVLNSKSVSGILREQTGVAEIYKVGLFPDKIGRGRGKFYVSGVMRELLKTNHTVYLNTRDNNKVKSVPFYQRLGMRVIKTEYIKQDQAN